MPTAEELLTRIAADIESLKQLLARPPEEVAAETQSADAKRRQKSPRLVGLGPLPDLKDEAWPAALPAERFVANEAAKQLRACQIMDTIAMPFEDKTILDFGCGEGHVAAALAEEAQMVVGYDKERPDSWDGMTRGNLIFLSDFATVKTHAPFDIIILFDVLDHMAEGQHVETLTKLGKMLADGGKIFVRTHPWTARHGGHLYEQMNKAFLHLALTDAEMDSLGLKPEAGTRVIHPMATYEQWFHHAGLAVESKQPIRGEELERYFSGPLFDRILKITWAGKIDEDRARKIMVNQFIDYWLTAA